MFKTKEIFLKAGYTIGILVLIVTSGCHTRKSVKPNVILILADDLGWTDAEFMGSDYYQTPNLDSLAAGGVVFTDAYANAPNCAPSRASLLTGLYASRHGIYTVNSSSRGKAEHRKIIPIGNITKLDSAFVTIAEVLKSKGYETITIGKWHLGDENSPQTQGFERNIAGHQLGHPSSYFSPYKNPALEDGPEGEFLTERLTEEAIRFIRKRNGTPFFMYFPHYAVHTPIQAKDSIIDYYEKLPKGEQHQDPVYAAMIQSLDESIGRLIRELKDQKIENNTLLIFMSDNGGHMSFTSQLPLRGGKGMLYEGGIRVPLIISWPVMLESGRSIQYPVIGTDLFPTILDLLNISNRYLMDGISLKPLLIKNKQLPERPIFWHFPVYLERYRGHPQIWRTTPASAVRIGDWKLIEFYESRELELYNLRDDIGETKNLAIDFPEKARELLGILRNWQSDTQAPVPEELNPDYNQEVYDQDLKEILESVK